MSAISLSISSLGEFITMGGLIVKIGMALYRPGDCTKDYKGLLLEVDQVSQLLSKVKVCEGHRMTPMAQECFKKVQDQAELIGRLIKEFLDKGEKKRKRVLNRIVRAINGRDEMPELKRRLWGHLEVLRSFQEMYLSTFYLVYTWYLTYRVTFSLQLQQLNDVMVIFENNIKDIQTIARQCPEQITWIDAIGNYRKISFDFCLSYKVRLTTLVQLAYTDID
jgi:hypothetical protein